MFKMNFSIDSKGFQDYYRDLAKRVKGKDNKKVLPPEETVDLIIVVGMFLTGFDAPTLNTLFVDKNLRYHGLNSSLFKNQPHLRFHQDFRKHHHIPRFRESHNRCDHLIW
jgi:hypothetical protein